VHRMWKSSNDW